MKKIIINPLKLAELERLLNQGLCQWDDKGRFESEKKELFLSPVARS